jgi:hypothetical protein
VGSFRHILLDLLQLAHIQTPWNSPYIDVRMTETSHIAGNMVASRMEQHMAYCSYYEGSSMHTSPLRKAHTAHDIFWYTLSGYMQLGKEPVNKNEGRPEKERMKLD